MEEFAEERKIIVLMKSHTCLRSSFAAKDCGLLKVPLNGSLVGSNLTTFPNSLTFTCDEGFNLKGSPVRKCQANAVWSGSETFCQGDIIYRMHYTPIFAFLEFSVFVESYLRDQLNHF